MARRKRNNQPTTDIPLPTRRKRKKAITSDLLLTIEPITENQKKLFEFYSEGKNIFAHGVPGSGKSFSLLYNALRDVLDETTPYETVYIVRSLVQTRSIGFMPGDEAQKSGYFEVPYKNMVKYMFQLPTDEDFDLLYGRLKEEKIIKFYNTSFIRGLTLDNCIILVDEIQNLNSHEAFSMITRVGVDSKIVFSGDIEQSDLTNVTERNGIIDFMNVIKVMPSFELVEFDVDDIVRSNLVKEFVIAKRSLGL
jgi:predicted ribonuclease YlaK